MEEHSTSPNPDGRNSFIKDEGLFAMLSFN